MAPSGFCCVVYCKGVYSLLCVLFFWVVLGCVVFFCVLFCFVLVFGVVVGLMGGVGGGGVCWVVDVGVCVLFVFGRSVVLGLLLVWWGSTFCGM